MTRDYKSAAVRKPAKSRGSGGSFLVGLLVGLLLGLAIALGVAWYLNRSQNLFTAKKPPEAPATKGEKGRKGDDPKADSGKGAGKPAADGKEAADGKAQKDRFQFYKILPGNEDTATDKDLKDAQKAATQATREQFYLQAGAFQSAPDADNLKARLALLGVEANIQTTAIPDKGTWHRVRLGPFARVEELNRVRDALKSNGIDTTLIRVRDGSTQ